MSSQYSFQSTESWIDSQLSIGKYSFALDDVKRSFPDNSDTAIKFSLKRLVDKRKILSIYKGYYIILPPQYASKGILPPTLFLDSFMKFLNRPYYVSLLNAAAFHGAAHQQPQEYFVTTNFPVLRPTIKKGLKINYISTNIIPESLIEKKKTEAGYINISNNVLTAADLIQYEKRVGGLNRAAAVIEELAETIHPEDFNNDLIKYSHATTLQRLGFLLEKTSENNMLADALYAKMNKQNINFFRIPLKPSANFKGFSSENRWKIIPNIKVEINL